MIVTGKMRYTQNLDLGKNDAAFKSRIRKFRWESMAKDQSCTLRLRFGEPGSDAIDIPLGGI